MQQNRTHRPRQSLVAQTAGLLYRRLPVCAARKISKPAELATPCRRAVGDTADRRSALLAGSNLAKRLECGVFSAAFRIVLITTTLCCANAADSTPTGYSVQPVSSKHVQVTDGFWSPRLETNRIVTIPYLFKKNAEDHRLDNLKRAARMMDGAFVGRRYDDTDVFKLLEAVGYSLLVHPDPALERIADEQIDIIAKGQEPDGYIYAARTIDPKNPARGAGPERWSREGGSHELYNMGHLIEAAIAYSQATGKQKFLDIAVKCADMLCNTFGPDKRHDTSGHEEIELALVKLSQATGKKKYLELSRFFIDQRGQPHTFGDYEPGPFAMYNDRPYRQDDKPVIEQAEAQGHAVRATYLYCGLTDIAALTGEPAYTQATDRLWRNVVGRKMYITGGVGSTGGTEAFAADYVLPNQSYCESCAAIGNALWNERLFRLHRDAQYLDVMERIVYNGVLSGIGLRGDRFFYQNPLQSTGRRGRRTATEASGEGTGPATTGEGPRQPWFDVACCPANLARFVAQFPGYIYAQRGDEVYVNFFVGSRAELSVNGHKVVLKQETRYPWEGDVKITVDTDATSAFALFVRIPGWAEGNALPSDLYRYVHSIPDATRRALRFEVNGQPQKTELAFGFASARRVWKKGDTVTLHLPMLPRMVAANEKVEADRGLLAIEHGPLLYCVEGIDNSGSVSNLLLNAGTQLSTEFKPNLLGGVTIVKARSGEQEFTAVPYYAWGNRGIGTMSVWLRRTNSLAISNKGTQ